MLYLVRREACDVGFDLTEGIQMGEKRRGMVMKKP